MGRRSSFGTTRAWALRCFLALAAMSALVIECWGRRDDLIGARTEVSVCRSVTGKRITVRNIADKSTVEHERTSIVFFALIHKSERCKAIYATVFGNDPTFTIGGSVFRKIKAPSIKSIWVDKALIGHELVNVSIDNKLGMDGSNDAGRLAGIYDREVGPNDKSSSAVVFPAHVAVDTFQNNIQPSTRAASFGDNGLLTSFNDLIYSSDGLIVRFVSRAFALVDGQDADDKSPKREYRGEPLRRSVSLLPKIIAPLTLFFFGVPAYLYGRKKLLVVPYCTGFVTTAVSCAWILSLIVEYFVYK